MTGFQSRVRLIKSQNRKLHVETLEQRQLLSAAPADALGGLVNLGQNAFKPAASVITFDGDLDTQNPSYEFDNIKGLGNETIQFGGSFLGQTVTDTTDGTSITLNPHQPDNPLALDPNGPAVYTTNDSSSDDSPVLSGTPLFNGPISIIFSQPVAAVGLSAGYFDLVGSTAIEAYTTDGTLLGTLTNPTTGFEFYGLEDASGANVIKGVSVYITSNEPHGFEIDNVTFGTAGTIAGPPAQLAFAQQPTLSYAGNTISPSVAVDVEDTDGNIAGSDHSNVTLGIFSGPTGGTLVGTTTVAAVNGVATFSDLSLPTAGVYRLIASDASYVTATSNAFGVVGQTPEFNGSLIPSVFKSTVPAALVAGVKVHNLFEVNVTNESFAKLTGKFDIKIFASIDGGLDGAQWLLTSSFKTVSLAAGKASKVVFSISSAPLALAGANFTLTIEVSDASGNLSGDIYGPALQVATPVAALSDLFNNKKFPVSLKAGAKTTAVSTLVITNTGNIAYTGSTTITLYASLDGFDSDGTQIKSLVKKLSIKPGKSTTVQVPLKAIPALAAGTYYIVALVKAPNRTTSFVATASPVTII